MEKYGRQFKDMNFKERVAHIWEYYRWHILAFICGGGVVICVIVAMLTPQVVDDVDILLTGIISYNEQQPEVEKKFREEFKTGIDIAMIDWNREDEMKVVMLQKIPLLITTRELDILTLNPDTYQNYMLRMGSDMFVPLDEYPECAVLLEKYKDRLVTSDQMINDNEEYVNVEEHVYGIRVKNFENIPSIVANEDLVIGITSSVKDLEKAVAMLDYILNDSVE